MIAKNYVFGRKYGNITLFGSFSGSNKWIGGVLAPNGKIYGIPYDSTQVLEISGVGSALSNSDWNIPSPVSGLSTSSYNRYENKL